MAELRARLALVGSWRWCPRCQFKFKVPSAAEAEYQTVRRREAGEYAFRDADQTPPEYVSVRCRVCGTAIDATLEQVGQEIACPDCGTFATMTPPPVPQPKPPPTPVCEEIYELCEGVDQPDASHKLVYQTYLRVICPECRTQMLATLEQVGQEVVCPDCQTPTTVPPPAASAEPLDPSGFERPRDDEYALAPGVDQPALQAGEVRVRCPHCQTLLQATIDQIGTEIVCHDCGTTAIVPEPKTPTSPLPTEHSRSDEFAVGAAIVVPEYRRVKDYRTLEDNRSVAPDRTMGQDRRVGQSQRSPTIKGHAANELVANEADDDLGPKPLAADVASFLFQNGVWQRWLGLSTAAVPIALVWADAMTLYLRPGIGNAKTIYLCMGLIALAGVFTLIWAVPAAAIALAVIDNTSAGADRVEHGPEAVFTDWILHILFIFNSLVLCQA